MRSASLAFQAGMQNTALAIHNNDVKCGLAESSILFLGGLLKVNGADDDEPVWRKVLANRHVHLGYGQLGNLLCLVQNIVQRVSVAQAIGED
jgi:hypothetical protein